MQVQEVVKLIHGMETLSGRGFIFEGLGHQSYLVNYPIHPECRWHDPRRAIEAVNTFSRSTPLEEIWAWGESRLGCLDALDLSRELVRALECPACGLSEAFFAAAEHLEEDAIRCPKCRRERAPIFYHSIERGSPLLKKTAQEIDLPLRDILWVRNSADVIGIELAGDCPFTFWESKQAPSECVGK